MLNNKSQSLKPTLNSSLLTLTLSRGISLGVPGWDSNPGLPYSKPTHYCLSYAAPKMFCKETSTCPDPEQWYEGIPRFIYHRISETEDPPPPNQGPEGSNPIRGPFSNWPWWPIYDDGWRHNRPRFLHHLPSFHSPGFFDCCPLDVKGQCCGYVTFWYGSGSADPYIWLTDPAIFISDLQYIYWRSLLCKIGDMQLNYWWRKFLAVVPVIFLWLYLLKFSRSL